jgi:hypothetical protein
MSSGKHRNHIVIYLFFISLIGFLIAYFQPSTRAEGIKPNSQPAPTFTPLATAINYDLLPVVESLLIDNGGCDLPCWWGFEIGETSETDWLSFLEKHNLIIEGAEIYPSDSFDDGGGHIIYALGSWYVDFRLGYGLTGTTLDYLKVSFSNPGKWLSGDLTRITFSGLLEQLGEQYRVYMRTDTLGQWSLNQVDIWILNEGNSMVAQYTFNIQDHQPANANYNFDRKISFCLGLTEITGIQITIQDPKADGEVKQIAARIDVDSTFHTLEETLGVDTDTFVQFFIENPDGCLEVQYLKPT